MHRRHLLLTAVAALTGPLLARPRESHVAATAFERRLAAIERAVGGRLGVAAIDVGSARTLAYRADERFAMCSTFKWLLAAQVLARVDRGEERLERRLAYGPADLLAHAPVTRARVDDGAMSVVELCDATVRYSDNTAANLLLATLGGPAGFTEYLRSIGDPVSRLDRVEPALNSAVPGDPRDTTTPAAMAANLRHLLLGRELRDEARARLTDWLVRNTTGGAKLRAGLPVGWRVGDKTGMGANGATNDVAIVWPGRDEPVLVAAYLAESSAGEAVRNAALADVARVLADWVAA